MSLKIGRGGRTEFLAMLFFLPPIGVNIREDGFTEDRAVIEVDGSNVDMSNFVDFSRTISDGEMWSLA